MSTEECRQATKSRLLAPLAVIGNTRDETQVAAVAWCLMDAANGELVRRTETRKINPTAALDSSAQLAMIVEEMHEALADATLVSLGPQPLRQHLYPAAQRANAPLNSAVFGAYIDLCKELALAAASDISGGLARRPQPLHKQQAEVVAKSVGGNVAAQEEEEEEEEEEAATDSRLILSASLITQANTFISDSALSSSDLVVTETAAIPNSLNGSAGKTELRKVHDDDHDDDHDDVDKNIKDTKDDGDIENDDNNNDENDDDGCSTETAHSLRVVERMQAAVCKLLASGHEFTKLESIKRCVEVGLCEQLSAVKEHTVVRARGLPWQATEQDLADFFVGLNIVKGGVALCLSTQGRRNGEALVRFESHEQRALALKRHRQYMGQRYIEVYKASSGEFMSVASGFNQKAAAFLSRGAQVIVRIRGLPFACTASHVVDFFASTTSHHQHQFNMHQQSQDLRCQVMHGDEGVLFVRNADDKPTGDAFVLFANERDASKALQKHKHSLGARYVELFRSSTSEVQQVLSLSTTSPLLGCQEFGSTSGAEMRRRQHQHQQPLQQTQQRPRHLQADVTYAQVATLAGVPQTTHTKAPPTTTAAAVEVTSGNTAATPTTDDCRHSTPASPATSDTSGCCAFDGGSSSSGSAASGGAEPGAASSLKEPDVSPRRSPASQRSSACSSLSRFGGAGTHHNQQHHRRHQQAQLVVTPGAHAAYAAPAYFAAHQPHQQHMVYGAGAPPPHLYAQPPATFYPPYGHHHHYPQSHHQPVQYTTMQVPHHFAGHHQTGKPLRNCVRLRGLPYEASVEHVLAFLADFNANIAIQGIHMVYSAQGQPSGEAFVQMDSEESAAAAAQRQHRKQMAIGKKSRYIEVSPCSIDDLLVTAGYALPYQHQQTALAGSPQQQHQEIAANAGELPEQQHHHHHQANDEDDTQHQQQLAQGQHQSASQRQPLFGASLQPTAHHYYYYWPAPPLASGGPIAAQTAPETGVGNNLAHAQHMRKCFV